MSEEANEVTVTAAFERYRSAKAARMRAVRAADVAEFAAERLRDAARNTESEERRAIGALLGLADAAAQSQALEGAALAVREGE